jgi:type II secretory pathway pseudopilin PulG
MYMATSAAPYRHPSALKQAGDTIVEVVIAVAIISTVLAGAFTVSNRSTVTVQDSEEHAQALQLLQGQVELLRSAAADRTSLPVALNTPFCLAAGAYYQPAALNGQCLMNNLYRLSISSPQSSPNVGSTTVFNLTASWTALHSGTNTVYLSYKVEVAP